MSITYGKSHPQEPDFNLDKEVLAPDECYILFWTGLPPIYITDSITSEERVINFPPFSYVQKVIARSGPIQYYVLVHRAKRVRNYLSFCFFERIPMYYKFIGKNILQPSMFQADVPFLYSANTFTQENVDNQFVATYNYAKELLENTPVDSFNDHVINLFGAFFWTDESQDRFMYAWRLIEMISNQTLSSFSKEDFGEFGNHVDKKDLEKLIRRMHITDKIRVALRKKTPHVKLDALENAYKIRNKIFHGALSSEMYANSRTEMEWVATTAQELVKIIHPAVFTGIQIGQ